MTGLYTNYIWPPSDVGGGFCEAKDGGRENALMKFFITTPQSALSRRDKGSRKQALATLSTEWNSTLGFFYLLFEFNYYPFFQA